MADVSQDLSLSWDVAEAPAAGYARIDDLKLGSAIFSSTFSKQDYLDTAWVEIEARLGQDFVLPLAENLPRATRNYLKTIHSYMATAGILIEGNGSNNEEVSATGLWMRAEADRMLDMLIGTGMSLDGLERRVEQTILDSTGAARNLPGISTKDAVGAFEVFEQFAHTDRDQFIHPTWGAHEAPYVPGAGRTRR